MNKKEQTKKVADVAKKFHDKYGKHWDKDPVLRFGFLNEIKP